MSYNCHGHRIGSRNGHECTIIYLNNGNVFRVAYVTAHYQFGRTWVKRYIIIIMGTMGLEHSANNYMRIARASTRRRRIRIPTYIYYYYSALAGTREEKVPTFYTMSVEFFHHRLLRRLSNPKVGIKPLTS